MKESRGAKTTLLQYLAQKFRVAVLDILHQKGTGHWGGASSAAELLVALYFEILDVRPEEPLWPDCRSKIESSGSGKVESSGCARMPEQILPFPLVRRVPHRIAAGSCQGRAGFARRRRAFTGGRDAT